MIKRLLAALVLLLALEPFVSAQGGYRGVAIIYPTLGANANHRFFRFYPGVLGYYDIGAIGGSNQFTYSISGHPSWLSVTNAGAGQTCNRALARAVTLSGGTLDWVPCGRVSGTPTNTTTDDDAGFILRACDVVTATCADSDSIPVDVTTTGFKFVSSTGSNSNNGAIATPFLDMLAVEDAAKVDATDIIYWCAGACDGSGSATFLVQCVGVAAQSSGDAQEARCEYNDGDGIPTQWLAYTGETITLNHGYDGSGADGTRRIRFTAPHIWFGGFRVDNVEVMGLQLGIEDEGATVTDNTFLDLLRGVNGSNSAFIMTQGGQDPEYLALRIANNDFGTLVGDPSSGASSHIKLYSTLNALIDNNLFHNAEDESAALKESVGGTTFRYNAFYDNTGEGLGGNMASNSGTHGSTGEFAYNDFNATGGTFAILINRDGQTGALRFYRNTIRGTIQVNATTSDDGPFTFTENVVINAQGGNTIPYVTTSGSVDASRVTSANDLRGNVAAAIVDAFGLLQGGFIASNGPASAAPRGFETSAVAPGGGGVGPAQFRLPRGLRVR